MEPVPAAHQAGRKAGEVLPAGKAIAGCPRGILVRYFWQKCHRLTVMSLSAEASAEQVTWHRVLVHRREQAPSPPPTSPPSWTQQGHALRAVGSGSCCSAPAGS